MSNKRNVKKKRLSSRGVFKDVDNPDRTTFVGLSIEIPQALKLFSFVDESGLQVMKKLYQLQEENKQLRQASFEVSPVEVMPPEVSEALVSIATNAWRAKNKMVDEETDEPKDEMHRVFRHIEGIFNAFEGLDLKVIDPKGRPYDTGMALKAISFEQTAGLSQEEITETIKPTILWRGLLLQTGEVIVGTPINEQTSDKKETHE